MPIMKILKKVREFHKDITEDQLNEIVGMLVEHECASEKKIAAKHIDEIEKAIDSGFKSGEKYGREQERRNFLGWDSNDEKR